MTDYARAYARLCAMRILCENYDEESCSRDKWQYVGCPLMVKRKPESLGKKE